MSRGAGQQCAPAAGGSVVRGDDHDLGLVLQGPLGHDPGPIDRVQPFCYNVVYP